MSKKLSLGGGGGGSLRPINKKNYRAILKALGLGERFKYYYIVTISGGNKMTQEIRYVGRERLENLPEIVEAGTSFEVGGFYTIRDMSREEYLNSLELQELVEKYFK